MGVASETMVDGRVPADERQRLAAVRRYDILDTPPDGAFDRITALAARLFKAPIAIVSIVDRDRIWFKSHHGLDVTEIGRDPGLCASAILQIDPYVLADAKRDPRSLANPLVAGEFGLRFYAAAPLRTSDGFNLGTLCVIDKDPRPISAEDLAQLQDLASIVMDQLELRRSAREALAAKEAVVEKLAAEGGRLRQSEDAFRESEAYLRLVLDSTADGFYGVDRDGVTTICNAAFLRMLGFERAEDVIGKNLHDVIRHSHPDGSPNPKAACPIYHAAQTGKGAHVESELFYRLDGSSFPVEYWAHPISGGGAVTTLIDITERQRAQEQQALLLKELDHRVKNLFAIVGGVVTLSARTATSPAELAATIQGRLSALASAHQLVRPNQSAPSDVRRETTLEEVVRSILAPYLDHAQTGEAPRATIDGPNVALAADAVTGFALIFHELATNAAKYGAFSAPSGRIRVSWEFAGDRLLLSWEERGGPALEGAPEREGFGSLLARRSVNGQLGGELTYDWNPEGLVVHLSAAAERLTPPRA